MATQSIASRHRKPQHAEPDDAVLARVLQFSEWARKNMVLLVGTLATILILVAGFFWYRANQRRQEDDAAIAFLQVEQAVLAGNPDIATRDLQSFIQQHGGTDYEDEARVLLGQVQLSAGKPAEALAALEPAARDVKGSPVSAQAALLVAAAQEASGKPQDAIETYLRIADETDDDFRRQEALMGAALLRMQANDNAGAAELFRRLVDLTEPGSSERALYEMRLAEAEALVEAK
jgi:predicted negative regulator of RcsB-dependent stress response